jgi:signal recognition particle GTPase
MASAASSSSASSSSAPAPADTAAAPPPTKPSVIITIGMAGAGKSTFVQRLAAHLHARAQPPYVVNLDPAITRAAFEPNIDIRDTVNYQEVMKQCVSRPARVPGADVDGARPDTTSARTAGS